ncbi:MAG: integration host factor subunit beta [Alphaproteobacteria bacterium]|nr:integration host factor subunit beta [Alphaproteobacteria bacterium]
MIKSELINKVAEANDLTHHNAERVVNTVLNTITKALVNDNRVELRGFGVLSVRKRKPRAARNPKTGAGVQVEAKRVPFFKAGKAVKDALNKKS